jgi:flagellar M-ring protein FliF
MLDKVLGPGNAVVTVAADVSNSTGTKHSETYSTPQQAPALSESTNSTKYANGGGAAAGANGASGVLGTDTTNGANGSTGGNSSTSGSGTGSPSYQQVQSVKNNAVDKTTTDQTITPGTLNRQTIAVALNSAVASQISATQLQQMVSNAAGVNTARGDVVSVTSVAFSNAAAKSAASALKQSQAAQSASQMTAIITTAIQVVGGLVLLVLLVGLLRKLFKRPEPTVRDAGELNVLPLGGDPALGGYAPTAQLGGLAGAGALSAPFPGTAPTVALESPFAQLQADVDALAGTDPEQTAEYLRALMGDRAGV